jgi:hypothetical protein
VLLDECILIRLAPRRNGDRECRQGLIHHHSFVSDSGTSHCNAECCARGGSGIGATLPRIELRRIAAQSFGRNFHEAAVGEGDGTDVWRLFFARDTADL